MFQLPLYNRAHTWGWGHNCKVMGLSADKADALYRAGPWPNGQPREADWAEFRAGFAADLLRLHVESVQPQLLYKGDGYVPQS